MMKRIEPTVARKGSPPVRRSFSRLIGKGSGRTAATVLGAVGGGYVGHKVEERTRTTTAYQMRVRMQDGSVRSFTRSQPVAEGTPVRVQGKGFRVDDGSGDADRAGTQPVRVVDRGY